MIRHKSIVKGAGSYVFSSFRKSGTGVTGAYTSEGSYAIFMRYLLAVNQIGVSFEDKVVLELGPGSSFGLGFGALLAGARKYYAVDLIDHTVDTRNIQIFDDMVGMFKTRAQVPTEGWCAKIFPFIDEPDFPQEALPDDLLARTLGDERLKTIRNDLATKGNSYFRSYSSTRMGGIRLDEPANIIFSESVLEHVDQLQATYEAFGRWLAPGGVMAHLVDFGSHNLSDNWNGHWQCSPALWTVVRGKRYFLINRAPLQTHLDYLKRNGFEIVDMQLLRRVDGASRDQFVPEFRSMSFRDSTTALASIVCRRRSV